MCFLRLLRTNICPAINALSLHDFNASSTFLFAKLGSGNVFLLYTVIVRESVLLSAFIDNIPYVAIMLPVITGLAETLGIDPTLLYFGLLSGATLGSNCTPIGASANIAGIGFPFTLAAVIPAYIYSWVLFG